MHSCSASCSSFSAQNVRSVYGRTYGDATNANHTINSRIKMSSIACCAGEIDPGCPIGSEASISGIKDDVGSDGNAKRKIDSGVTVIIATGDP